MSSASVSVSPITNLLDQHTVHVSVSLRQLQQSVQKRKLRVMSTESTSFSTLVVGFPRANVNVGDDRFSALPGAITEARTVSRVLGCEALVGDSAATRPKKATVMDRLASSLDLIHLATHGQHSEDHGPRLLLDGEARQSASDCGEWLTPEDIMRCRPLSAQLAVLSACHSGSGRTAAGEGVVGLARALLGAGVQTVVVALWALPDEQTSSLMSHFYDRLTASERVDVGDAMREAMLRTRADVVAGGQAIAGVTEGHWSGLMVLGCGTVSLRVASSSCTTVVPEGVPPEPEPELELEPEPEPEPEGELEREPELEPEPEPEL